MLQSAAHSQPRGAASPPASSRQPKHQAAQQRRQPASRPRLVASAAPATAAAAPGGLRIQQQAAVERLAAAAPAYAAALDIQQACLDLAAAELSLQPVLSTAAPRGLFSCESHDGGAGAAAVALRGQRVHWLSASALATPALSVGTCRLLGWAPAARDVPHLLVEAEYSGDTMRCTVALWPRQEVLTDLDYLHRYYGAVPEGAGPRLRPYDAVHSAAHYAAASHAAWHHHQPAQLEAKPLMGLAISYAFPPDPANLEAARGWALEAAELWAAFLQAGGRRPADEAAAHRLDSRYFSSITSHPGNQAAVRLFGQSPTDLLLKMATGHPNVQG